jgi:colanic acid biosynthesis protein WcaH
VSEDAPIPQDDWERIVEHVPLVSVDLVVHHGDGVVLGKRTNEPAKGEWFVPGGRVRKHEPLEEAVHRVAREELGVDVTVEGRLGVSEHFYDVADVADADGKHHVPVGFEVSTRGGELRPDDQHGEIRQFTPPFAFDLHPYVSAYLTDAGVIADGN